jgi:iron complex outermembrane recepter protein
MKTRLPMKTRSQSRLSPPGTRPEPAPLPARDGLRPSGLLSLAFAAGLLMVAVPDVLGAQDAPEPERPADRLDTEITVTATFPELAPVDTVEGRELEELDRVDLAEGLRFQSGLSAARRGPINLDVTIRGLQETQVATLVDGTRTFAAGPGRMDSELSHLSPNAVERVEIVKGPYALTWGAGTLSAIDVRTRRPSFTSEGLRLGGRAAVDWTSNAEAADAFGQVAGSSAKLRFDLLANYREGSDYESGNGRLIPGDYTSEDALWGVGGQLSDRSSLDYTGGYQAQDDIDYPGRQLDATYFRTRSHRLAWAWAGAGGSLDTLAASIYSNRKDHRMNNDEKPSALDAPGRMPPFGLRVDVPTESNTSGARGAAELSWSSFRLKVGADHYRNEQNARRYIYRRSNDLLLFEDIAWPEAELTDSGVYGQGLWSADRWELGVTLRLDRWDTQAGEVSDFFREYAGVPQDRDDTFASAAIAGRVQLDDRWSLSLGVGSASRTPTTLELYSDRFPSTKSQIATEFLGNPMLDPERSFELDAGVVGSLARGLLTLDLFARRVDDYITVTPALGVPKRLPASPATVLRTINGEEARFWGGELRWEQPIGRLLRWRAAASYTHATDETFDEPVLGIAPLQGELGLRVHSADRSLWGDVAVTLVDDQDRVAVSRNELPTGGYQLLALRGGWEWRDGVELFAAIDNATDEEYAHHLNSLNPFDGQRIPEMGRSVSVGVRFRR